MFLMLWVHLIGWWLIPADQWLDYATYVLIDRSLAPGFLFVSGISAMIYYKSGLKKTEISETYNYRMFRNEYLIRALLILGIGIIFNSFVALAFLNPLLAWNWFLLQAIGISLLLVWLLLKTSKFVKLGIALSLWIINYFLLDFLLPYEGEINIYGVLYHLLYGNLELEPIMATFSFFLLGTFIGEVLYEIYSKEDKIEMRKAVKNNIFYPSMGIGVILVIFAFFSGYPQTLSAKSFSWIAYSVGIMLIFLSIFIIIEEYELIKTKKDYRILFFFSYYSLTLYLGHNILYFLFLDQLFAIAATFIIIGTNLTICLIFRLLYYSNKRNKGSIKVLVGYLAKNLAVKIDQNKKSNTIK
jgi:hypothetical protein